MNQPSNGPQSWWQPPSAQEHPRYGQAPPPAQPQNFGGGFQSEYGGFGAFGEPAPSRRRRSWTPIFMGITAVVLLGGVTAAWLLGAFRGDVLDAQSVEDGVATVLRESYGEHDVSNVECPEGQRIVAGHTFECSVDIAGKQKAVQIRVLNDKPEYEVGAPR